MWESSCDQFVKLHVAFSSEVVDFKVFILRYEEVRFVREVCPLDLGSVRTRCCWLFVLLMVHWLQRVLEIVCELLFFVSPLFKTN